MNSNDLTRLFGRLYTSVAEAVGIFLTGDAKDYLESQLLEKEKEISEYLERGSISKGTIQGGFLLIYGRMLQIAAEFPQDPYGLQHLKAVLYRFNCEHYPWCSRPAGGGGPPAPVVKPEDELRSVFRSSRLRHVEENS